MTLLNEKVTLVTGASRGIGKAICLKFAAEGAIVYAGVRNINTQFELPKEFSESGGKIIPVKLDVCSIDNIKECIITIKKNHGRIDVLVNNAGITILERLEMIASESIESIYSTNVFGMINVTKNAMRLLKKSSSPVIINMSSIMAAESDIGQTVYAGSKAATESMTRTWAKEYSPIGLRVNAIAPGNVNTDMFNIISEEDLKTELTKIGLGRIAEPEEIANVALFLASDMSSYITGEVINVNGGLML